MVEARKVRGVRRKGLIAAVSLVLAAVMLLSLPGLTYASGWGRLKNMDKFWEKVGKSIEKQSNLKFSDCDDAMWALSSIAKMRGLGIINGYGNNLFKPNANVKQAEALTMMVRAFDLEDEAAELEKTFGGYYSFAGFEDDDDDDDRREYFQAKGRFFPVVPIETKWALGYILVASDEGWVKFSEIRPNEPASRAWISMVMVRALGHEEDAQDKMDTNLPFKDKASVRPEFVGYVAQAVDMGLFEGYEDGTFKPNNPVTRAEMAVILERYIDGEIGGDSPYMVKGRVTAVSSSSISVKTGTTTVTYEVSRDALVVINRASAKISDVRVGDSVEVLSNGSGVALLITVTGRTSNPVTEEVVGEIVAISYPEALTVETEDDTEVEIELDQDCAIKYGKRSLDFEDLNLGDEVEVTVTNGKASMITVLSRVNDVPTSGTLTGVIETITHTSSGVVVILETDDDESYTVTLASGCTVRMGSTSLAVGDLDIGDTITATIRNQKATAIRIIEKAGEEVVTGTIRQISTGSGGDSIVLRKSNNSDVTIALSDDVEISYDDESLDVDDLRVGDEVEAHLLDDECYYLEIVERGSDDDFGDLGGTVTSITHSSSQTVLVLDDEDDQHVVTLTSSTVIKLRNTTLGRNDIRIGDEIRVELDDETAVEVRITDRAGS